MIIGKVNAYLHNKNISMKGNKSQTNKITSEQSKQNINNYRRTLLCIPDGWGINQSHPEYDATELSNPVNLHRLEKEGYFIKIHTDGEYVGLPAGQMGNSEVGHLNMGAGRVIYQELSKINNSIKSGDFFENEEFLNAIQHVKENNSALHIYGLASTGGVHSSLDHISALIDLAHKNNVQNFYVHVFTDGRDTPPKSALKFIKPIEDKLKEYNFPPISTVSGRYYAMDRDNRWNRVEKAYNALILGDGEHASSAEKAIENSYAMGINDEFILPTVIGDEKSRINDNDAIIFWNFRPDRARELTKAINMNEESFDGFERKKTRNNLYHVCMTPYDENFPYPVAFKKERIDNVLGDILEKNGITQFRTAETEKYAHITFFFNGGVEKPQPNEIRVLVSSPKVSTYDMQPEMSAHQVCDNLVKAINDPKYGFMLVNFANPDMVGHTGNLKAAIEACKTVDDCIGVIAKECKKNNVTLIITPDHGNADEMVNPETGKPHTAHTTNQVPFIIYNSDKNLQLKDTGALCNVAPTILDIMGIDKPKEMTSDSLIVKD